MNVIPIQDFDPPGYDPFLADELVFGSLVDPYTPLAALRNEGPVHFAEYRQLMGMSRDVTKPDVPTVLVLGYDAAQEALTRPDIYSNGAYREGLGRSFGRSISIMDGPEHLRYRRIFQQIFLPGAVRKWGESLVDPIVTELLDKILHAERADLVADFTLHYPFRIIYRLLDLPPEQAPIFHRLAVGQTVFALDPARAEEASAKLGVFFARLLEQRRSTPADDLITRLLTAEVEGERLPEDVIVSFLRQLINAAGDTTYRATSVLLTALLRDPAQLGALREDRALLPQAIEEALRWDGPVLVQSRLCTQATVLAGVAIPEGAIVQIAAGAANRDPDKFDQPDRFDLFRPRVPRHLGFSTGPHACLGQHLARVEMDRAMNALLDRLPGLRLDTDAPAPEIRGILMRAPRSIHVKIG